MKKSPEVISSLKHPAVVGARVKLGQVGKKPPTACLFDGRKLAKQALESSAGVDCLFFLDPVEPEDERLMRSVIESGVECHILGKGIFARMLDLGYATSARVIAIVEARPLDERELIDRIHPNFRVIIGESIRDPRNVGVIIRTADAFGLDAAVFTADSADPWSRPSVRSTTGSILRTPVMITEGIGGFLNELKREEIKVIGSSAGSERLCWSADMEPPLALLVGSESTGLADDTINKCDSLVKIPMFGGASSLNVTVAAGILAYESVRQGREREGR